ncbi:MAG: ankyrin repeat domain-containing protein [Phycisphaerae bacterium]|nr:ankyrin repeat domain-containing protein [Phycisphaerae bacterium]
MRATRRFMMVAAVLLCTSTLSRAADGTDLHNAVARGDLQRVAALLAAGADVNAVDQRGFTPLHVAATSHNEKLIQLLLDAGADVNACDASGETPLHVAARHFRLEGIELLLASGADVHALNTRGDTPLHVLGSTARVQDETFMRMLRVLAERLIAAGADPAIIADGFPALQPHETPRAEPTRDTWTDYDDIGPDLLAYQNAYPSLARRYNLGLSYECRYLWAIKISDNVNVEEDEPEFKYIATMHGDEIVGTKMCMNLINDMLTNYGSDPQITNLIDEIDIWIVPLMNPDGYDRVNRTRYNAQGIDLNRDFPEGTDGDPNTPTGRAVETQVIMNWSFQHSFTASANFHGGALVVNYPFDNDGQGSVFSPTPDEDMFVYISEEYSYYNSPMWNGAWYHGITNGAAWYSIDGGMQDWNYRYMGNNEVTIELSDNKEPPASQIGQFWSENRDAMLSYMETCLIGVRGLVTDANTGAPLAATVTVTGRDHEIYTDPDVGDYHRMLMPGTYEFTFEAAGYDPQTIPNVVVYSGDATRLDVQMGPSAQISYPNGGETLTANVETDVTWLGNPTAQFHVQYTDNYGQSGSTSDGFESGSLGPEYTTGGDANWFVTSSQHHSGSYCARAGDIGDYDVSWMTRNVGGGQLSFWYRVSSEANYDYFNFYIDGTREIHVSGNGSWQYYSTTLSPGSYELKWEFDKDQSLSHYDDTAYLDDLELVDDQTTWHDIIALTAPGAGSTPWTPTTTGSDFKVRVRAYYGGGSYGDWDESDATFTVEEGPAGCPGDSNCDDTINWRDIDYFVAAMNDNVAAWEDMFLPGTPTCPFENNDVNADGTVNWRDIDPLVEIMNTTCP